MVILCITNKKTDSMKNKSFLMTVLLITVTSMTLVSCSKEDPEPEVENHPLSGTLWSCEDYASLAKEEYTRYIEFIDEKQVKVWDTYNGREYNGSYTLTGNKIVFHNLYDAYWMWYYVSANFTSHSLTLSYSYNKNQSNLYKETYRKE